jgi:hypothetical protein
MPRCPACRETIEEDRERVGARCPYCRMPLYERGKTVKKPAPATDKACALHPHSAALDACPRCGALRCDLCRVRWRGQVLCLACVNRALEANEPPPAPGAAPTVAAILALLLGLLSWAVIGASLFLVNMKVDTAAERGQVPSAVSGLVQVGSPAVALLGVILGMAALRIRGWHLIPAALGVGLGSTQLGVVLGLAGFALIAMKWGP